MLRIAFMLALIGPSEALAQDTIRIATWKVELGGKGPGLLLRDILSNKNDRIADAMLHIASNAPDVLLLTGFDTDYEGAAARAFANALGFDYSYSTISNAGVPSSFDIDKDGKLGEPEDALAYGRYTGHGGMAVLSNFPIEKERLHDFSTLKWRDLPENAIPAGYFDAKEVGSLPLSSHGHWIVPVQWNGLAIDLLAFSASSPVFDGPEDRNGARNADEIRLWQNYLDNALDYKTQSGPFVILGNANLDPIDGEGHHEAIQELLQDPRINDPMPKDSYGARHSNQEHSGDPRADTADWRDPVPGNLRVDYVLPSTHFKIHASGISWLEASDAENPFRHGLVWVDLAPLP